MRRLFFYFAAASFLGMTASSAFAEKQSFPEFVYGAPNAQQESRTTVRGVLQPFPGSFTLTPVVEAGGRWISRKNLACGLYFDRPALPLPLVICNDSEFRFEVRSFVQGENGTGRLLTRYQIRNKSSRELSGHLYFIICPARGGRLWSLDFSEEGQSIWVNEKWRIYLSPEVSEAGFFKGISRSELNKKMVRREIPQIHSVKDPDGKASGVWSFSFHLKPGKRAAFGAVIPMEQEAQGPEELDFRLEQGRARAYWMKKRGTFDYLLQDAALAELLRIQLSSLLIARDEPGIYSDDFGRDQASTSQVLEMIQTYLRFGWLQEAREDLEMVSLRVEPSGAVLPAMKSGELSPDVKDYRLQGQFVAAVLSYYEFSKDKTWLEAKWPIVENVLEYLQYLRRQRVTGWYAAERPELRRFYGILPPSGQEAADLDGRIGSRHWYSDDFWALKGLKDGQVIGAILGKNEKIIKELEDEETLLRRAVFESIEMSAKGDNAGFIPEAAEKSVFDADLGALVVWPAEEVKAVTAERLQAHLDNGLRLFKKEREMPNGKADEYSSFEVIRAMLRRGEKARALEIFRYRLSRFQPDDFVEAASLAQTMRDFAVYEEGERLVLAAGVSPEWIGIKKPFSVRLPTCFGEMIYSIQIAGKKYRIKVSGEARPPQGFVIKSPSGNAEQVFQRSPVEFDLPI